MYSFLFCLWVFLLSQKKVNHFLLIHASLVSFQVMKRFYLLIFLFVSWMHSSKRQQSGVLLKCVFPSASDVALVNKIIPGWGVNDRDRGEMRELLMGDIICVSPSEHLSIYIQSCCGPQPGLMHNSCRTCEKDINTVGSSAEPTLSTSARPALLVNREGCWRWRRGGDGIKMI